jgi:hypothetical protein
MQCLVALKITHLINDSMRYFLAIGIITGIAARKIQVELNENRNIF